ncbi:MAG: hypothetical protein ACE5IR_16280, partial [bacterium]
MAKASPPSEFAISLANETFFVRSSIVPIAKRSLYFYKKYRLRSGTKSFSQANETFAVRSAIVPIAKR